MESKKTKSNRKTVFSPMSQYIYDAIKRANDSKPYPCLSFEKWWDMVHSENNLKRKALFQEWAEEVITQVLKDLPNDFHSTFLIGKSWNRHHHKKNVLVFEEKNAEAIRKTFTKAIQENWLQDRIIISTVDSYMSPGLISSPRAKIFAYFQTFDDGSQNGYLRELVIDRATLKIEKVLSPA